MYRQASILNTLYVFACCATLILVGLAHSTLGTCQRYSTKFSPFEALATSQRSPCPQPQRGDTAVSLMEIGQSSQCGNATGGRCRSDATLPAAVAVRLVDRTSWWLRPRWPGWATGGRRQPAGAEWWVNAITMVYYVGGCQRVSPEKSIGCYVKWKTIRNCLPCEVSIIDISNYFSSVG